MKMIKRLTEYERGLYIEDQKTILDIKIFTGLIESSLLNQWGFVQSLSQQWSYFKGFFYLMYSKPILFASELYSTLKDVNTERWEERYFGDNWQGVDRIYNCSLNLEKDSTELNDS